MNSLANKPDRRLFHELDTTTPREILPGFVARFVHSQHMSLAYWDIAQGAVLPEHSHPHEQVANVLEGQFELTVGGESKILGPMTVAVIPPNAVHSGKAITKCRILDVFYPLREDYF